MHSRRRKAALLMPGLRVIGVVTIHSAPPGPAWIEKDNIRVIRQISGIPVLGTLPFMPELASGLIPRDFARRTALNDQQKKLIR